MAQDFNILSTSNIIREDVARHNTNYATLRSQFSGTTFPSNPSTGQPCFRTDLGQTVLGGGTTGRWYIYSGNPAAGLNGWVNPQDMGEIETELVNARGSKLSLDQRLDIALNEDGTLRDNVVGVINQYQELTATYAYVDTTTFTTTENTSDIFLADRRIKVNLNSSYFYTNVVSSTWSGTETTIIIADDSLDNTLLDVEYHLITPDEFVYWIADKISKVSSVDNTIPRFNGASGDIQGSNVVIDDSDHIIAHAGITLGTSAGVYDIAKTLDDYEEGTWTPTVPVQTARDSTVFTNATYTKLGRIVHIRLRYTANFTNTAIENTLQFDLPFAMDTYVNAFTGICTGLVGTGASRFFVLGMFTPTTSNTLISVYGRAGSIPQTGTEAGIISATYITS